MKITTAVSVSLAAVKCFPVYRYSVIFTFSSPLGQMGSNTGKQNAVIAVARGHEGFCILQYLTKTDLDSTKPSLISFNFVGSPYLQIVFSKVQSDLRL